ncbi:MAG: hypothetical protein AUJ12_08195 [Alphaproteobacteria bacterium CG1_02_46_17]|nr:MAG: hypothetical protein AUJ12_08195 [Alphaproteobacteria bacterium CG1_02_46_17]
MDTETLNRLKELKPSMSRYGLKRLRVFGSTVRNDYSQNSDVDLLVEFDEMPSLFDLVDLQTEIERSLNKKVDLVFEHKLFPELKNSILGEAIDV